MVECLLYIQLSIISHFIVLYSFIGKSGKNGKNGKSGKSGKNEKTLLCVRVCARALLFLPFLPVKELTALHQLRCGKNGDSYQ